MIAIGVHRLFVVRLAGVLRRNLRLIAAKVARLHRAFHEVDDRRVHAEPIERTGTRHRELRAPAVLLGTEPRTVIGPDECVARRRRTTEPPSTRGLRIGVVLLRGREHEREILDRGIDLLGTDEAVEQRPAVALPGLDFIVRGEPSGHGCHFATGARMVL